MTRQIFVITVAGELGERLQGEFEGVEVTVLHGVTRLRVVSADASRLHGILHRIEVLGLDLLDVRHVGDGSSGDESPDR